MSFLRKCPGSHVPVPTKSLRNEGHYCTWLEVQALVEMGQGHKLAGLQSSPSSSTASFPCKRGCQWVFAHKTSHERHDLIVHTQDRRREQQQVRREKHAQAAAPPPAAKEAGHVCNFLMPDGSKCSFTASTPHYLRVHKEQMGHRRKRSAPTGDQTGKRRKP